MILLLETVSKYDNVLHRQYMRANRPATEEIHAIEKKNTYERLREKRLEGPRIRKMYVIAKTANTCEVVDVR